MLLAESTRLLYLMGVICYGSIVLWNGRRDKFMIAHTLHPYLCFFTISLFRRL